jgi:protease IV
MLSRSHLGASRSLRFIGWVLFGLLLAGCTSGANDEDFFSTLLNGPRVTIEPDSFLELSLSGPLTEGPSSNPFADLGGSGPRSLWEIRRALLGAAKDGRIAGLKLEIEAPQLGFGAIDEISELLDDFRHAGKPVYAYLRNDFVDDAGYYLALGADRIFVAPQAALMVNGLRAEVTFWRGTLEKLGIVPHVIMFKEYKSAGEPYSRQTMSAAFRESLTAVLKDLEDRLDARISERRGLPPVQVKAGLNLGLMTTAEALETGWIDGTGYRDAVEHALASAVKAKRYRGVELRKYLRAVDRDSRSANPFAFSALTDRKKASIALVFGEGPIVAAAEGSPFESLTGGERVIRGLELASAIDEAADNDQVRAIVFRVDSPGGSAVGSDHVYDAIRRARQRGKKVVVSMSSVAGSGGYWISMGADKIVAQPSTITGSIGVVSMNFDVRGFYTWIGAHVDTVSLSKGSGILSQVEDFDEARQARWTAWMTAVYENFKKQVAIGRKLSAEQVEERAKGRIWSGVAALQRGLVDGLGGLDTAIDQACSLASLGDPKNVTLEIYPKRNAFEEFLANLFAADTQVQPGTLESLARSLDPAQIRELTRPRVLVMLPDIHVE